MKRSNPNTPIPTPELEPHDYTGERIRLLMKLRKNGITDTRVLGAIESIPRELFVSDQFKDQAYEDTALPIELGQTISQPTVVAEMTEALQVDERTRVLEIGTGSGYQAAILAKLCRRLYTIERHKDLLMVAEKRFAELGLRNITAKHGDGYKGWKEAAPFDRIIVTAAAPEIPSALIEQLAPGGIMVIPVGGKNAGQELLKITKSVNGSITHDHLMGVRFVPMVEGKTTE